MNRFLIAMSVTMLLAAPLSALAAQDTGTIKSIDKTADSITLADGKKFKLPEKVEAETFKVGEKVRIDYSTDAAGKTTVSTVVPLK